MSKKTVAEILVDTLQAPSSMRYVARSARVKYHNSKGGAI